MVTVSPPASGVYRLGRSLIAREANELFAASSWDRAHDDGTFGHRFDDPTAHDGNPPDRRFRAIYCATQRIAAFGETLAHFRPSLSLLAELSAIEDDESLVEALTGAVDPEDPRRGLIPADWRLRRRVEHTVLDPSLVFVDIAAPETIQHLRASLAPLAHRLGLGDVDLGSLTGQQRRFTQGCARYVYDQREVGGQPRYAGLRYPSRLNHAWECWAVFHDRIQHQPGWPAFPVSIFPDDGDLLDVAALLQLIIEVFPGQGHYLRP